MKLSNNAFSRQRLIYTCLMFGSMGLGFAKWILFAGIIQPTEFGTYATLITTTAFLSLFGIFGLNEYLIKEGSLLTGRGAGNEISMVRNQILIAGLLNSSVIITVGVIFTWQIGIKPTQFLLISIIFLVNVAFNIVDASLRAAMKFSDFGGMIFIRAVLLVCLGFALAPQFGLSGILFAEAFAGFVSLIFGTRSMPINMRLPQNSLKLASLLGLLSKGRVFLGLQTSRYFSLTVDKWIVGWFSGAGTLGRYSFVLITFLGFMAVAGVLNAVLIPKLIAKFGKDGNAFALRRDIVRLCGIFIGAVALAAPLYIMLANFVVERYFKNYHFEGVILALAFVYIGSALHVTHHFFDSYFYSQSRQRELSVVNAMNLLFFLFAFVFVGLNGGGVVYFSIAFMASKIFLLAITSYGFIRDTVDSNRVCE